MLARFCAVLTLFVLVLVNAEATRGNSIIYGNFLAATPGEPDFLQVLESSVTDAVPLYGPPSLVGSGLVFFPASFASSSASGGADTTSGTLRMRIHADAGFFLQVITIVESGAYRFAGNGTPATSATINGLLTITDVSPGTHATLTDTLTVLPAPVYKQPGNLAGDFTAITHVDLTGLGISDVVLNFNDNLQTTSQIGTTAFIEKKQINIYTPEPTTLGLLLAGVFTLRGRRGRRRA
jgi:hypothetical protein